MATNEYEDIPEIRLDKRQINVVDLIDGLDEIEYWKNTTIKERLQHLERLRRTFYGARVIEVVQSE
jgi:hypothetical protein